jgi:hypothetical protein
MPGTYYYYTTLDLNICVDENGAYITLEGETPDQIQPIPVVAGFFSASWAGKAYYFGCSGDINASCTLIAPNTFQCTITGSNLDCSGITGGYAPFTVNETITVVLDGNPTSCVT